MITHEVLWDGTSLRPWNRMLFAPQSVQTQAPPSRSSGQVWGERTVTIKRVIRQQSNWFTADDIAALSEIDRDHVFNVIGEMVRKGAVIKGEKLPRQTYRLVRS